MSVTRMIGLLSKGVSRPALYQVIVSGFSRNANDQLEFLCKTASIPSVGQGTIAVNGHESMGVVREQPTRFTFDNPLSLSVISDRDYTVYKQMKQWMNRSGQGSGYNDLGGIGGFSQRMAYYDEVTANIEIVKLELDGGKGRNNRIGAGKYYSPFRVTFNKCIPVRLGELQLSSDATDSAMEFETQFAYENYSFSDSLIGLGALGL